MPRVTAVVCAAFDAGTDAAVERLREDLRAARLVPVRPARHRPHLTLAAASVEREEVAAIAAVAATVAASCAPVPVRLGTVGRFGRAGVVWLGPDSSPELHRLQAEVVAAVSGAGFTSSFGAQTDPAWWVPHCTIVTRVDRSQLRAVHAAVSASFVPLDASIDGLATILVGGQGDAAYARLGE